MQRKYHPAVALDHMIATRTTKTLLKEEISELMVTAVDIRDAKENGGDINGNDTYGLCHNSK